MTFTFLLFEGAENPTYLKETGDDKLFAAAAAGVVGATVISLWHIVNMTIIGVKAN